MKGSCRTSKHWNQETSKWEPKQPQLIEGWTDFRGQVNRHMPIHNQQCFHQVNTRCLVIHGKLCRDCNCQMVHSTGSSDCMNCTLMTIGVLHCRKGDLHSRASKGTPCLQVREPAPLTILTAVLWCKTQSHIWSLLHCYLPLRLPMLLGQASLRHRTRAARSEASWTTRAAAGPTAVQTVPAASESPLL